MKIASVMIVIAICVCAVTKYEGEFDVRHASFSVPGMVNDDPEVKREIDKAAGNAEELLLLYHQKLSEAKSPSELDQADAFYDNKVVPAQIALLKMESRRHSFEYRGMPTPSEINRVASEA